MNYKHIEFYNCRKDEVIAVFLELNVTMVTRLFQAQEVNSG